jgi:pimeloyl-ACP methyl ester carboxylesterase
VLPALGAAWVIVAAVVIVGSSGVLVAGHPAYGIAVVAALLVGIGLVWYGFRRTSPRTWLVAAVGGVLSAVLLGSLLWLQPFGASSLATGMIGTTSAVRIVDTPTTIELQPPRDSGRALVFQPGARVDARAYVPLLTRVAAEGYLVVIVKQPLGIGFLAIDAPDGILRAHPAITSWAVGGHSLGGVAASSYAAAHPDVKGLVLWASYPASSIADRPGLAVASISGSADGLATTAKVDAAKPFLPSATTYTVIPGGIHAYFGDYGDQPGDGTATVSRDEAQAAIAAATVRLLASL